MNIENYQQKAKDFLNDTKTSLEVIEAVPQKSPLWTMEDGKHGLHYSVTLKNSKNKYTFDFWGSITDKEKLEMAEQAETRGIYSSHYHEIKKWCEEKAKETVPNIIKGKSNTSAIQKDYTAQTWLKNIVPTVKILIKPTAYDVLSCLSPLNDDTFEDFCSSYGYNTDSINALKTYEAVKNQDYQLRKLFSHEEIEKLAEIQ